MGARLPPPQCCAGHVPESVKGPQRRAWREPGAPITGDSLEGSTLDFILSAMRSYCWIFSKGVHLEAADLTF